MKNRGIFCFLSLFFSFPAFSQHWHQMIGDPRVGFFDVQKAFYQEWEGREYESGSGYTQFKRLEYFLLPRVDRQGFYFPHRTWDAFRRFRDNMPQGRSPSNASWSLIGPTTPPGPGNSDGIGRIDCMAFHPSDPSTFWAGAPSGGLWKTSDNGASWQTATDGWEGLGVSDIVINPDDPDILYVATGDRDHIVVASFGILKSTDGGVTWSVSGLNTVSKIYKLLMDPDNSSHLLAGTNEGVFRSLDAGASWVPVASIPTGRVYDMAFKPDDPQVVYAAVVQRTDPGYIAGFYRSADNGATFLEQPLPFPSTAVQRIAMAVTPQLPDDIWLSCVAASYSGFYGLFRSSDSGLSFREMASPTTPVQFVNPPLNAGTLESVLKYQGWYDWCMAVNPLDTGEIYLGGVGLARSTDGGDTWVHLNTWAYSGASVHVDFHSLDFHPLTNQLYTGCDGGVWRDPGTGGIWERLTNGLVTTQDYTIGSSTEGDRILVGTQDNNTFFLDENGWSIATGGDGMGCLVDPGNEDILYTSSQRGYIYRSADGGESFINICSPSVTGQTSTWVTTFRIHPFFREHLYALYEDVWKSEDAGNSWINLSDGQLTGAGVLTLLEVASSDPAYLYAGDPGHLFRSTDGGSTWTPITAPGGEFLMDLVIHPDDPNTLWVCKSNGKVYRSADGGINWTDISGSLPAISANTLVYQQGTNDGLYAGMDVGVYYLDNTLADWQLFNTGLPNVVISGLEIISCEGKIRAATYGRSVWESDLYSFDPVSACCPPASPELSRSGEVKVCGFSSITLASGPAPSGYGYQWYKDGIPLGGTQTGSLEVTTDGTYFLVYSHQACPSFHSDPAKVVFDHSGPECFFSTCADFHPDTDNGPGNRTVIEVPGPFPDPDPDVAAVSICVTVNGNVVATEERFDILDEGGTIHGITATGANCGGPTDAVCFEATVQEFNTWIADGVLTVSLDPRTIFINPDMCLINEGCVSFSYRFFDKCPLPETLLVEGDPISSGVYQAQYTLISNGVAGPSSEVTFIAGNTISLLPGFHAKPGGIFHAYLDDCSEVIAPKAVVLEGPREKQPSAVPVPVRITPNPFHRNVVIECELPEADELTITITDLAGRMVRMPAYRQPVEAGINRWELDGARLESGIFLVAVRGNRFKVVQKMVRIQ